jgi:hypothetical protein
MNKEIHYFGTVYIDENLGKEQAFSPFKHAWVSYEKCSSGFETVFSFLSLVLVP